MESKSKKTRTTKNISNTTTHMVNIDDRLSNLPQDILHYILSFLETRDVIQLSQLSRRWRHVWKSMPYLNFDQTPSESKDRFIGFAWSVLSLRDGFDIKRFRFSCHGIRKHVLKPLLSVAKNRGVVVLDLDIISFKPFENGKAFELLSCFADCRSLPEINLTLVDSGISYIDSMSLAMVRTLHLENSELCGQTFGETEKLVLRCPHLENLLLKNCYMRRRPFDVIDIEAANLKNLKFLNTAHKRSFRGKLKISTPNLLCLSYRGPALKGYSLQNLSSLNKALIHFTNRVKDEEDGCLLLFLVSGLYNAEVLYLSSHFLQHLSHLTYKEGWLPPTFLRLKSLTLSIVLTQRNMTGLLQLLSYSPILEALRIDFDKRTRNRYLRYTNQECESLQETLEHNVSCLTHHLKKVEINSFVWRIIASDQLVKYLLENGKVLEKMTITCQNPENKRFVRLQEFGRASPNVAISFTTFMERKPLWFEVDDGSGDRIDVTM